MKARILYLIIAMILLSGTGLQAQLSFGIHAGINRATFSGDSPSNAYFEPRKGFNVGIRTDYRFSQVVSMSIQSSLAQTAIKYVVADSLGERDSMLIRMTIVSLPVQAIVWTENGRFFVTGGVRIDYNHKFVGVHNDTEVDLTTELKRFNISAEFGAGFLLNIGRPYITFELRYTQGLVDMSESILHGQKYFPRTKLTNLSFQIAFQIPLGAKDNFKIKKKGT